jgi:hypothetical protein
MTLLATETAGFISMADAGAVPSAKAERARVNPNEADVKTRIKITLSL